MYKKNYTFYYSIETLSAYQFFYKKLTTINTFRHLFTYFYTYDITTFPSFSFWKGREATPKLINMSGLWDECIFYDIAIRDFTENWQALVISLFVPALKCMFAILIYHKQHIRNILPHLSYIYLNILCHGVSYTVMLMDLDKSVNWHNTTVCILPISNIPPEVFTDMYYLT